MNPAMRSTPEVLFARDVARSCRTGNYIAFFRLARKATYLQACLMHAHFSKLRTHALASLHSGLQKNQGIPIIQIAEWLGMEGEDTEELLDHHGFSVRQFEEPYMVKEGPFLNSHMYYPTRRSQLVISKCSTMVFDDVKFQGRVTEIKSFSNDVAPTNALERIGGPARSWRDIQGGGVIIPEEEMPDYEEEEQPSEELVSDKDSEMQDDDAMYTELNYEDEPQPSNIFPNQEMGSYVEVENTMRGYQYHELDAEHQNESNTFRKRKMELQFEPEEQETHKHLKRGHSFKTQKNPKADKMLWETQDVTNVTTICATKEGISTLARLQEDETVQALHNAEAMAGRIRLWLRRWRLRTSASIQDKSHKKERAEAALLRLALGPPLRETIRLPGNENNTNAEGRGTLMDLEFDLNKIIEKRNVKLNKMWTELDVPSVVAQILKGKNPRATCLCWKLVVCSRLHDNYSRPEIKNYSEKLFGEWLKFKLFNGRQAQGDMQKSFHRRSEIAVTSDVTECHFGSESGGKLFLCYIAQELGFINKRAKDETGIHGASGLLFLLLNSLPIDEECARLHAMVESIPSGSRLPLLILTTQASVRKEIGFAPGHIFKPTEEYFATILQLDKLDKAKVSCWLILPVMNPELSTENNPSLLHERHFHLSNLPKHADIVDQVSNNLGNSVRGFYENITLIEGLQWLASKTPVAPNVHPVYVRDLVLEHLEPHLRLLQTMHPSNVTPESCIGIFNRSLENAIEEIKLSASTSIPHWPPPELGDLSEGAERNLLHAYLPSAGWNEPATLQPILDALQCSMLPPFPDLTLGHCSKFETTNFLPFTNKALSKHGIIDEIHNQKLVILYTFAQYMGQLGEIGEGSWSTGQQLEGILEKSSILNWTDTGCDVIPKWAYLFQIIYQTRLLLLNSEPAPVVYVHHKSSVAPKRDEYEKALCLAQGMCGRSPVSWPCLVLQGGLSNHVQH
ncbi:hypothetical protein O6H91_12G044800 [Diphasiastrum complanatum]|nr:hypothetical protein O6H91_Y369700 [Diphasiastrum complanatum]KAJ7535755.1 hypothetical protein O6H91_12G044800 [Diphasiastrum complanatum]